MKSVNTCFIFKKENLIDEEIDDFTDEGTEVEEPQLCQVGTEELYLGVFPSPPYPK